MDYVHINLPRCLLVLTVQETLALLARDPELWQTALKRGKGATRVASAGERIRKQRRDGGNL